MRAASSVVFRANDPLAADLVREWANRYEIRKLGEQGGEVFERKGLEKADEALACARAMERWLWSSQYPDG